MDSLDVNSDFFIFIKTKILDQLHSTFLLLTNCISTLINNFDMLFLVLYNEYFFPCIVYWLTLVAFF